MLDTVPLSPKVASRQRILLERFAGSSRLPRTEALGERGRGPRTPACQNFKDGTGRLEGGEPLGARAGTERGGRPRLLARIRARIRHAGAAAHRPGRQRGGDGLSRTAAGGRGGGRTGPNGGRVARSQGAGTAGAKRPTGSVGSVAKS